LTPLDLCIQTVVRGLSSVNHEPLASLPWHEWWPAIEEHGIASLLYPLLKQIQSIPGDILEQSRRACEDAAIHIDFAAQVLADLRSDLTGKGRVVILKGMALAELVYREPFIRSMGDVDLLLPDGTMESVTKTLARAGFEQYRGYPTNWRKGGLCFDLHEDIRDASRIPERDRGAPAIDVIESTHFPGYHLLAPQSMAAHIAFHAVKHNMGRAVWWVDLLLCEKKGFIRKDDGKDFAAAVEGITLGYLADRNLETSAVSLKSKNLRGRMLFRLFRDGDKPGLGELSLALSFSRWTQTIGYLQSSIIPQRKVLEEMYGKRPFPVLIAIRVSVMIGYLARFLWRLIIIKKAV
jgi:hypothetical protein